MTTCASLFSGFGGWDLGAKAAGLSPRWAIEFDPKIAEVYARNLGEHIITAGVQDVDPAGLEAVDVLFTSPPCQQYSKARTDKSLAPRADADIGLRCIDFIRILKPRVYFLENVPAYAKSPTFNAIVAALFDLGYWVQFSIVNAADYGVPQTRKRLILRATLGEPPRGLPQAERWVGWYEAIEDLIPGLPESKLAPWQVKRIEAAIDKRQVLTPDLFIGGANKSQSFLDFAINNRPTIPGIRIKTEPIMTVPADPGTNLAGRALLFDVGNTSRGATVLDSDRPSMTITTWFGRRPSHMPVPWIEAGRVVSMTSRAVARFQSFPDSYNLPEQNALACKGIGNAVPPLLAQRLIEATI